MNGTVHRTGTLALSLLMAAIGIALMAQAVSGAGILSPRMLLGLLFVAAGALRVYLVIRKGRST